MTAVCCPDCYSAVDVPPHAREGRCGWCRPRRTRAHSEPRTRPDLQRFIGEHNRSFTQ
jgi:hypothetical protein